MPEAISPKAFISYSWSTTDHEEWVKRLATELIDSGVDVILDKWDLREGHDSIAFMEQMVTNEEIKKVILVCDEAYAKKTDKRTGGVGTEAQIISPALYSRSDQNKFVAVIAERDEQGNAFLPTYYKSRIYIDLSSPERYAENYEKLLRWIFDKPLDVKPLLGKPPSFITEANAISLGTSALARMVTDAVRNERGTAAGALDEYLTVFSRNLERFRITTHRDDFDEEFMKSIGEFLPARNEFIGIISTLSLFAEPNIYASKIHRFFESILRYYFRPEEITSYSDSDFDNYKFIVHELFLYSLAIMLRAEKFGPASVLLNSPYYVPLASDYRADPMLDYTIIRQHLGTLEHRKSRTKSNRTSIHADLLKERSQASGVEFVHLMQADFVCYLADQFVENRDNWWPETLLYATRNYGAFEVFARSQSRIYLINLLGLFRGTTLEQIQQKIQILVGNPNSLPRWNYSRLDIAGLAGSAKLGTQP
jgi:hypothetical protein